MRGADVFVIQPTCYPVNDNLIDLLIIIDALKRASAQRINCVIPYYAYARSDKKDQPLCLYYSKAGSGFNYYCRCAQSYYCGFGDVDQIQGFNIPVDHLYAIPTFARYFKSIMPMDDIVVVSPDSGGANRARALAKRLNCTLAIGDKRRSGNEDRAVSS